MAIENNKNLMELVYSINNISETLQHISSYSDSTYLINETLKSLDSNLSHIGSNLYDINDSILKVVDEIRIGNSEDKNKERKLIKLEKQLKKYKSGVNICYSQMTLMTKHCQTCMEAAEIEKTERYIKLQKQHDTYEELMFDIEAQIEDLV